MNSKPIGTYFRCQASAIIALLFCPLSLAGPLGEAAYINYSLKPDLFSTQLVPGDGKTDLKEVQMRSGVGFSLTNLLLNVSFDYKLQGSMKEEASDLAQMYPAPCAADSSTTCWMPMPPSKPTVWYVGTHFDITWRNPENHVRLRRKLAACG